MIECVSVRKTCNKIPRSPGSGMNQPMYKVNVPLTPITLFFQADAKAVPALLSLHNRSHVFSWFWHNFRPFFIPFQTQCRGNRFYCYFFPGTWRQVLPFVASSTLYTIFLSSRIIDLGAAYVMLCPRSTSISFSFRFHPHPSTPSSC